MRLLLDTHVAVWLIMGTGRLSPAVLDMLGDGRNSVAVSLVSVWEIAIKNNTRRAAHEPFGISAVDALAEFRAADLEILPINELAIVHVETLRDLHSDPFDRLLFATAATDSRKLVTRDRRLVSINPQVIAV